MPVETPFSFVNLANLQIGAQRALGWLSVASLDVAETCRTAMSGEDDEYYIPSQNLPAS